MTYQEHISAVSAAANAVAQAEAALKPLHDTLRLAVEAALRDGLTAKVLRRDKSLWSVNAELVPLAPPRFLREHFPPGSTSPRWEDLTP